MKVVQIYMNASRTINLGNYESVKVEGACTIHFDELDGLVGEEESLLAARVKAISEIKKQMEDAFVAIKPKG